MTISLETRRLAMRPFTMQHLDDVAAMNADARVMEYFPATQTRAESEEFLKRLLAHQAQYGFAPFALHLKSDDRFVGFTGLIRAAFEADFTPATEIGWRFAHAAWGQGLGPEAAQACLAFGFNDLALDEIVSFTSVQNFRSRRVMEKIGMRHNAAEDFDHPNLPRGHALRRHVLYRLRREEWNASN